MLTRTVVVGLVAAFLLPLTAGAAAQDRVARLKRAGALEPAAVSGEQAQVAVAGVASVVTIHAMVISKVADDVLDEMAQRQLAEAADALDNRLIRAETNIEHL